MRAQRSLWTLLALLTAVGVALVVRGQGQAGFAPGARRRDEAPAGTGPALEGVARPARALPPPESASTPPASPLPTESVVTDDGETYSVKPEAGQQALTLRLTALGSGETLSVREWAVAAAIYTVPPGRVPRMPVVPGAAIRVSLAGAQHRDGSWRFLSDRLVIEVPRPAPDELCVSVPTLEDLTQDPLSLVPVDRVAGTLLLGGTWEPPPQRSDLAPISADADGRLAVPLALVRATIEPRWDPYTALLLGLGVPGHHLGVQSWPELTLPQLRHLSGTGELRVPLWRRTGGASRQLRVLEPDGNPASKVRVVVSDNLGGDLRLWTDARGILSWKGSAELRLGAHLRVFSPDGWLREVFELPGGAGRGDPLARVVLPDTALVTLEFVLPDGGEASRAGLPRDLSVGMLGRLYPPEGDPEPPAAAGVPTRVDNTGETSLETQLDFDAPVVRLRLPLQRELQLSTMIAPVHPDGHGRPMLLDFVLDHSDRRLVIDWPPTRILSREDR